MTNTLQLTTKNFIARSHRISIQRSPC